ncbi:MAG: lytic transglycosylase domain-containing protein [Gammaproteobacteria bacterium]|nr:lytic transglycosylase domain-containing protein [Gammaproteobacteria bacterium]
MNNIYLFLKTGLFLLLSLVISGGAWATEIYVFKDKDGQIHLTDKPKHDGFRRVTDREWKHKPYTSLDTASFPQNKKRFKPLIGKAARRYRVNEALLNAVVTAESAYDPKAVSKAGAVGLMQLMPGTAKRYGTTDRYDPQANVFAGTRYLRDLLKQFQNTQLALAAYNAGENNVIKYGYKIPPFKETQKYVRKVMHYYEEYQSTM